MNKQELIEEVEDLKDLKKLFGDNPNYIEIDTVIRLISKLDEPQPLKLKDVIKRIEGLNLGTKKLWLDEILNELGSDYGTLKYKDGYDQGKLEGEWVGQLLKDADKIRQDLNKPVIPQFVADWIEKCKSIKQFIPSLAYALNSEVWSENSLSDDCIDWLYIAGNQDIFARAWLDGYTVEKEKWYRVKMKGEVSEGFFIYGLVSKKYFFSSDSRKSKCRRVTHTRKDLENAGFGWVFNCPGIEIEEVEE